MSKGVVLTLWIKIFKKVVCEQMTIILFFCNEAEIQFRKPIVFFYSLKASQLLSNFAKILHSLIGEVQKFVWLKN